MRKFFKLIFSKFFIFSLVLLAEIAGLGFCVFILNSAVHASIITGVAIVLDVIFVLYILNSDINAEYKIAWIVPILALPVLGCLFYVVFGRKRLSRYTRKKLTRNFKGIECLYANDPATDERYARTDPFLSGCAQFARSAGYLPALDCEEAVYFKTGEEYAEKLYAVLRGAQRYIFLEYFIISPGKFWNNILEILAERARNGVDVRVIYDDFGSIMNMPASTPKKLKKLGIRCFRFNKYRPVLDVAQNNRTHRKIAVIDGEYAFTGGINLADEYINAERRFGHWKDTGVMIRGRAAQNFTTMFLQLWSVEKNSDPNDYEKFLSPCAAPGKYLCFPFADSPYDSNRQICEDLYIKMIHNAKKYVYINTPYLIIDGEMQKALITAAPSGVDVRITVPNIPDKKYVFAMTKAFYSQLVKEGVKIYRYTPGFIHAKSIVSDDKYCIIGSSNMDFRSFYLHFECDVFLYGEDFCKQLYADYVNTCALSEEITPEKIKIGLHSRVYRAILRIFAPLM